MPQETILHSASLLGLPIELRIQIYEIVLENSPAIVTFSAARLLGTHAKIIHRLYGQEREALHGLPESYIPVVTPQYDASLLSVAVPAQTEAISPGQVKELGRCNYSPHPSLLLVNRQIYHEIMNNIPKARQHGFSKFSIYIAFPFGLHVLDTVGKHLLPAARIIQICGSYENNSFSLANAHKSLHRGDVSAINSTEQLAHVVSSLLGPNTRGNQLQMRIWYVGTNSYGTVWGDDNSPIAVALKNICGGDIQIGVWRGRTGVGVFLAAKPSHNGGRNVSTVWRKFDGHVTDAKEESCIIDDAWPDVTWHEDGPESRPGVLR